MSLFLLWELVRVVFFSLSRLVCIFNFEPSFCVCSKRKQFSTEVDLLFRQLTIIHRIVGIRLGSWTICATHPYAVISSTTWLGAVNEVEYILTVLLWTPLKKRSLVILQFVALRVTRFRTAVCLCRFCYLIKNIKLRVLLRKSTPPWLYRSLRLIVVGHETRTSSPKRRNSTPAESPRACWKSETWAPSSTLLLLLLLFKAPLQDYYETRLNAAGQGWVSVVW